MEENWKPRIPSISTPGLLDSDCANMHSHECSLKKREKKTSKNLGVQLFLTWGSLVASNRNKQKRDDPQKKGWVSLRKENETQADVKKERNVSVRLLLRFTHGDSERFSCHLQGSESSLGPLL